MQLVTPQRLFLHAENLTKNNGLQPLRQCLPENFRNNYGDTKYLNTNALRPN